LADKVYGIDKLTNQLIQPNQLNHPINLIASLTFSYFLQGFTTHNKQHATHQKAHFLEKEQLGAIATKSRTPTKNLKTHRREKDVRLLHPMKAT